MEFTQGVRFDSLGLTEEVQRALKKKNIEESTPCLLYTSDAADEL